MSPDEPPEPAPPTTSPPPEMIPSPERAPTLELAFAPELIAARTETSSALELADAPLPAEPASGVELDQPAEPGPLGDLVAAHFQRVEIAMLARVLMTTLAGALPPAMLHVQRRRTLWQRLRRRPGQVSGIRITAGERELSFRAPAIGVAEASVGHAVRGVVLSSSPVPVAQWLDELAALLTELAGQDEATRTALERALLP